jgi:hypothetical protein
MPRRLGGHLDLASWSRPRIWLTGFLAFFALSVAWALATPLTAVPDEPAHIVKAAATVRGQLDGPPVIVDSVTNGVTTRQILTGYKVPAEYAQLPDMFRCYVFHKNQPASCAAPMTGANGDAKGEALVGTSAGGNNPAYYLAVGWTSLLSHGEFGVYLMRLVSALLCSAFLASAVATVMEAKRRRGTLLLGLVAAATPTALFLNGSVNPNGIEVSSGILVWCALLGLLTDPRAELVTRRLARAAIGSVVLVEVRPLGPVWVLGIVACTLLVGQVGELRRLLRRPATWIGSAVVTAATLVASAWSLHSNVLITATVNYPQYTFVKAARHTFDLSWGFLDAQIGRFGWLDVSPPYGLNQTWELLILALAVLAFLRSRRRERIALLGLGAAILLVPVLAQAKQAAHLGYIWQGRYLLAVSVGLPLLATTILAQRTLADRDPESGSRFGSGIGLAIARRIAGPRWVYGTLTVFLLVGFTIFYAPLRRYAVGADGPLFSLSPDWSPPGGILVPIVLYLLGAAVLAAMVVAGRETDESGEADGSSESTGSGATDAEAGSDIPLTAIGIPGQPEPASRILAQIGDSPVTDR